MGLPGKTIDAWFSQPGGRQMTSGNRDPVTLWSPYWHLWREARDIVELRGNRMHADHELSWPDTVFRTARVAEVLPEHTSAEILAEAPRGSIQWAQQREGLSSAADIYNVALHFLKQTLGDPALGTTQRQRMAEEFGRARAHESWSLTPPYIEMQRATPGTFYLH